MPTYNGNVAKSLHIVYASTSGHTEVVLETLVKFLHEHAHDVHIEVQRAECAQAEDLLRGDVLLLACGTWNTRGIEGQLNPHMHALLAERANTVNLLGKPVALIALGDDRYYYTARANEHLQQFVIQRGGTLLGDVLLVVNEPYGQEEKIRQWGRKFVDSLGDSHSLSTV